MFIQRRIRSSPSTVAPVYLSKVYGFPDSTDTSHYEDVPVWERNLLTEVHTPNSTRGHRRDWKDYQHYKCWNLPTSAMSIDGCEIEARWTGSHFAFTIPVNQGLGCDGIIAAYGDVGRPINGLPPFLVDPPVGDVFVPSPAGLDGMIGTALRNACPILKKELSLLNSIYELKDFASLPRTCRHAMKLLPFARDLLLRYNPKKRGKRWRLSRVTLRDIIRTVGDVYLQYKFNIAPLISDICGIYSALAHYERRINDLISRAGRPQQKHYSFRFVEYPEIVDEVGDDGYFLIDGIDWIQRCRLQPRRNVRTLPSAFHVEIEYNYNYTEFQLEHARVLAFLDSLGINFNPSIIWNAIPWTFVLDWVVNVSSWLDQFKVSNMKPRINIHRCLWSIKRERIISTSVHLSVKNNAYYNGPWSPASTCVETAYRRQNFMPSPASIQTSGLNSTEFTLGAALVVTRKRRHSKQR